MTLFTKRVSNGNDDWHLIGNTFDRTGDNVDWGNFSNQRIDGGFRFVNVTIPQGVTIDDAKLTWVSNSDKTGTPIATKIHCVDSDNAVAPTNRDQHNALSRTSAFTAWATPNWSDGVTYHSADFTSAVKEVIDRGGWSSNNALIVLIDDNGTSNNIWNSYINKSKTTINSLV